MTLVIIVAVQNQFTVDANILRRTKK